MVPDRSVDFAFSFDSLVHVEAEVLESYVVELSPTLAQAGVAFIHHSNLGAWARQVARGRRVEELAPALRDRLHGWLEPRGMSTRNLHRRAESVTGRLVQESCGKVGLRCVTQEYVNWGGPLLNDCFSVLTPAGSPWEDELRELENRQFMVEVAHIAAQEKLYGGCAVEEPQAELRRQSGPGLGRWIKDRIRAAPGGWLAVACYRRLKTLTARHAS